MDTKVIDLHESVVCVPTLGRILDEYDVMLLSRFPASVILPASKALGDAFLANPAAVPVWMVVEHEGRGIAILATEADEYGKEEAEGGYVPDLDALGIPAVPTMADFKRAGIV